MLNNPFRPGFGSWPPSFVGREHIEILFAEGLSNGPGSRYFTSLVTGARGLGKTVLLAAFRDIAESEGYRTIAVDANDGMIRRLCRELLSLDTELNADGPRWQAREVRAGATLPGVTGHVDFEKRDPGLDPFGGDQMTMLKPLLEKAHAQTIEHGGAGLFLTVDEMQAADATELERLGNDLQHVQEVAFAGAALPTIIEKVFSQKGATFFSRSARFELEPLTTAESVEALCPPFDAAGIDYDRAAMTLAADDTLGYPYLVQLLGYEIWHRLDGPNAPIVPSLIDASLVAAREQSTRDVLEPTWKQLSPTSKRILAIIARDPEGHGSISEIRTELGKSSSWISVYRSRLIAAGILRAAGRGEVELTGGERAATWIREQTEAAEN